MKNPYCHVDTLVSKMGRSNYASIHMTLRGNSLEYFKLKYLYGFPQKSVLALIEISEKESISHDIINKNVESFVNSAKGIFGVSEIECQRFIDSLINIIKEERNAKELAAQEKEKERQLAIEQEKQRELRLQAKIEEEERIKAEKKQREEARNREYDELIRKIKEEEQRKKEDLAKRKAQDDLKTGKKNNKKKGNRYNAAVIAPHKEIELKKHNDYLKDKGLGMYINCSSYSTLEQLLKEAERRYILDSELLVHIYNILKVQDSLKKHFVRNVLDNYVNKKVLTKRAGTESLYDKELLSIYNSSNMSAFDIMNEQSFLLNWNDVIFSVGSYTIYPPRTGKVKFTPRVMKSALSSPSLNYLREYFQKRLPDIECVASSYQLTIINPIELERAVRILAESSRQSALKQKLLKEASAININEKNIIPSFSVKNYGEAKKIGETLTKEELRKYKSWYVNWLADRQMNQYRVIPCNERYCHQNDDIRENAFIFTLRASSPYRVIVAVENLNTDRSTLLFSVREYHYEASLKQIHSFLQGPEINKRSKLRDYDFIVKNVGIIDFAHVDHKSTESYQWSEMMKRYLRNL